MAFFAFSFVVIFPSFFQIVSLENEVNRYRKENKELKRQNEDLQAQLIHDSIEAGQNLLKNFDDDPKPSLAEELSGKDSTEVISLISFYLFLKQLDKI